MYRLTARVRLARRPLSGADIHTIMCRIFPQKNDYGNGSFDELVVELARFGVTTTGKFHQLMTKHRKVLLRIDRDRLTTLEERHYAEDFGEAFVKDAVRRQYWFAYPGFIRNVVELEFCEEASISVENSNLGKYLNSEIVEESTDLVVTSVQKTELDDRLTDFISNPHDVISWSDVKAKALTNTGR